MAEDKVEPREINWRHLLPWTALFQGFRVALDLNKLLLAAGGILVTAIVWWVLAVIFYSASSKPMWPGTYASTYESNQAWAHYKADLQAWNVLHAAAGPADSTESEEPADLANTAGEYDLLKATVEQGVVAAEAAKGKNFEDIKASARTGQLKVSVTIDGQKTDKAVPENIAAEAWKLLKPRRKPTGQLRTLPWYEDRGSNPFLLVTGKAGQVAEDGTQRMVPWEKGHFLEWMLTEQVPVLLEPLVKMIRPVIFFFNPHASALTRLYFLLVMIATVAIWGLVGGAIARIAAIQVARQEKIGAREALRFATKRYLSLISAPMFPLILVAVIVLAMILFGVTQLVPILGEAFTLLWPLMILAGLGVAVVLVGLVGWPLMAATISAEGTDSWEAVSRSYSYVFGAPWHYIFYSAIALAYGAVLVFFIGFMGSAMVYYAKWGVKQTPGIEYFNRDPSYLFAYAPTSYEWRALLMDGAKVDGELVVKDGRIDPVAWNKFTGHAAYTGPDRMTWWNQIGAFFVMIWLGLLFLLILGFGYSYFWSASTIVYLLMRRKVDDTEMDEVYLEDEEQEGLYGPSTAFTPAKPTSTAPAATPGLTMVEAPALRTPAKEETGSTGIQTPAAPPVQSGDGSPPATSGPA
jgi:hypothetical protein